MKINIPFNEWSKERIRLEKKFATTRSKKYGGPGDWFECEGKQCGLVFVVKLPLWFIHLYLYETEGAESPLEFNKIWVEIHPKLSWEEMLGRKYYYHFWSIISPGDLLSEGE